MYRSPGSLWKHKAIPQETLLGDLCFGFSYVDIENEKVDIENVLSQKESGFSAKTTVHIHRLSDKLLIDGAFCQSEVFLSYGYSERKNKYRKRQKDEKQHNGKFDILPIM